MVINIIFSNYELCVSSKIFSIMPKKKRVYKKYTTGERKYRYLLRKAPNTIPTYTCPSIDKTIEQVIGLTKQLEKLRKQNEKLRNAAEYWQGTAEWLCTELLDNN